MEETVKMLVEVLIKEYKDAKEALETERRVNTSLADQNHSLIDAADRKAEEFARLKKLIDPLVKWEKDEAICLNSFDKKVIDEICSILQIGEKYDPFKVLLRSVKKGQSTSEGA